MKHYLDILQKQNLKVLITGDSLSYNRYTYYEEPHMNAYECGVGMPSWSFRLRDKIYALDSQLIYGSDISFNCSGEAGVFDNAADKYAAAFDGKGYTIAPNGDVEFNVSIKSNQLCVYFQTRPENFCTFDLYIDGILAKKGINLKGEKDFFKGYALLPVAVECDKDLNEHKIEFRNIKGENPKITVAAVGSKFTDINLTGKGSQTTRFFIDNFDERIGCFLPDLLIISLIGNDRARVAPEVMRKDLLEFFARVFKMNKDCKILFLLPPYSHFPSRPDMDSTPHSSIDTANLYNRVVYDVVENMGKDWYKQEGLTPTAKPDVQILAICDLFDKDDTASWRADNIHLNQNGNNVLLKAVCKILDI